MDLTQTKLFLDFISKHQYGGILDRHKINELYSNPTAQQDNIKQKPVPKLEPKPATKDMFGRTIPQAPEQGTIHTPYERSTRELLLKGLNSIDRDGKNEVIKPATDFARAGLNLLRPDKYYSDVKNDQDVIGATGRLLMDASTVAPLVGGSRNLISKVAALEPEEIPLVNQAYKLNPKAFKPNPDAYYRKIGDSEGLTDAIQSNSIRPNPNGRAADAIGTVNMNRPSDVGYYAKGEPAENYPGKYMVESNQPMYTRGEPNPITGSTIKSRHGGYAPYNEAGQRTNLALQDVNVYKKDWLKGYKSVDVQPRTFDQALQPAAEKTILDNGMFANKYRRSPTVPEGSQLDIGNKWSNSWNKDPIIQDRIKANNAQIDKYNQALADKGMPSQKIPVMNTQVGSTFPNRDQRSSMYMYHDNVFEPNGDLYGVYYHDHPNELSSIAGKAFVSPYAPNITSTAVHENTHQLTRSNFGISNQNERLLQSPFGGKLGIDRAIEDYSQANSHDPELMKVEPNGKTKLANEIMYLTNPTEVHARINQIRRATGMTPKQMISPQQAGLLIDGLRAPNNVVNSRFANLVKDPKALADVFNKMFTPAAVAGAGALALKPKEQ